jgi:hypothetical protein
MGMDGCWKGFRERYLPPGGKVKLQDRVMDES